jgi:hypothetical protein
MNKNIVHYDTIRSKILNEYLNTDERFYIPLEDYIKMIDDLNPNFTPKIYYERAQKFPELYKDHIENI